MKVAISGSSGYLGERILNKISETGWIDAYGCDLTNSENRIPFQGKIPYYDIQPGTDTVIFVSGPNSRFCQDYPLETIKHKIGRLSLTLRKAISKNVNNFFYVSTIHVYGPSFRGEITERTPALNPHPYPYTSKACEELLGVKISSGQIRGGVIRLSNCFGEPSQSLSTGWNLAVNSIVRSAVRDNQISLDGGGLDYRDFVSVELFEEFILFLLSRNFGDLNASADLSVLNFASGKTRSLASIAIKTAALVKKLRGHDVVVKNLKQFEEDPKFTISTTALHDLGFDRVDDFDERLSQLISQIE